MKQSKLTPKRERFCREYMIDQNGTQAAIRAGYAPKSANEEAGRLLVDVSVKALIAQLSGKQAAKLNLSAERTLSAIAEIAFGDIRKMFGLNGELLSPADWNDEVAASVAGMDIITVQKGEGEVEHVAKIKRADRLRALDMLARHHALYNDKLEVNVTGALADRLARAKAKAST